MFTAPPYFGYGVVALGQSIVWLLTAIGLGLRTGRRIAVAGFGLYLFGLLAMLGNMLSVLLTTPYVLRRRVILVVFLLVSLGFAVKCAERLYQAWLRPRRVAVAS
ncbi:hypothetical protein [Hymenobacter metallicola]|uniref:Uncharacterized protein n=1 Tax=Hymenobacter metallicola TaxID=2563114 RepID=A0A4Z0PUH9_9BACT|nr:hypothetical protein [Hymenobacter metallicola]TGE20904.1 hypothetical protein E5K02_25215 [Hymenobacter metallicola]